MRKFLRYHIRECIVAQLLQLARRAFVDAHDFVESAIQQVESSPLLTWQDGAWNAVYGWDVPQLLMIPGT